MVHESGFTIILFDIGSAATIETIAGRDLLKNSEFWKGVMCPIITDSLFTKNSPVRILR
jgi:hypothetical protein